MAISRSQAPACRFVCNSLKRCCVVVGNPWLIFRINSLSCFGEFAVLRCACNEMTSAVSFSNSEVSSCLTTLSS